MSRLQTFETRTLAQFTNTWFFTYPEPRTKKDPSPVTDDAVLGTRYLIIMKLGEFRL